MIQKCDDVLVEISQRLRVMRTQELSKYAIPDYLAEEPQRLIVAKVVDEDNPSPQPTARSCSSDTDSSGAIVSASSRINQAWRKRICEWCFQVVDHFEFEREVVSIAMSYFDRFVATHAVNRRIIQLVAITALHLAIKLFEPKKLQITCLIELSRGYFTSEHIIAMESSMLQSLQWHVHPPTPFAFCSDLLRLVSEDIHPNTRYDLEEMARFLTELSVCDYWFVTRNPSSIALAAIISAIELQGSRIDNLKYEVDFLHRVADIGIDITKDEEVTECYNRLRKLFTAGGYNSSLDEPPAETVESRDGEHADGTLSPGAVNHAGSPSIM
mmetsp:Transcript_25838/g.44134  ORF Transcript_25838/g.44134 Transcript_25838/m.44134 type:complete len:327 (-) Transcript_25838:145-1125(-)